MKALLLLTASVKSDIQRLQPKTRIPVFHGTSMKDAIKFVEKGIAGTEKVGRLYPHYDEGIRVDRGLFVTTDFSTATRFGGGVVIKFKALGKQLFPMFPRADRKSRSWLQEKYPHSFRPETSYTMLSNGSEPQALFVGNVSPRAIEKIFLVSYNEDGAYKQGQIGKYQASFDRRGFMDWVEQYYKGDNKKTKFGNPLFEPQEKPTIKEFEKRVQKEYSMSPDTLQSVVERLVNRSRSRDELYYHFSNDFDLPHPVAVRLARQYTKRFETKLAATTKRSNPMKSLVKELRAMAREVDALSPGVKRKLRRTHDDIMLDEKLMDRGENFDSPSMEQDDKLSDDLNPLNRRLAPTPSQEHVLDTMEEVEEEGESNRGIEDLEQRYAAAKKCKKGKGKQNEKSKKNRR